MKRQSIFIPLSFFRRQNVTIIRALFLLILFSETLLTPDHANGQPGHTIIAHSQDRPVDTVVQRGRHAAETTGIEPSEILDHTVVPGVTHFDKRFFAVPASRLLPHYLVYTQTTASRL